MIRIADIYYFGYAGLDLQDLRLAIPLYIGDEFADYPQFAKYTANIKRTVRDMLGHESTDEALVYHDQRYIVFIGLPGASNKPLQLMPPQTGEGAMPEHFHLLYDQTMAANFEHLKTRSAEAREAYFSLRDRMTKEAAECETEILQALSFGSNPRDRIVAAYALGLVASGVSHVSALVVAAHDIDPTVRNNAVRALGDLIDRNGDGADLIPTQIFIDLLVAPQWTDRNKGMYVLLGLAEKRDLALRRYPIAMSALNEMLQWPEEYAADARALLDRTLAPPS